MLRKLTIAAASVAVLAAFLLSSACNQQPDHPNQINAFDGVTYDSLVLAHGALGSFRNTVSTAYPQYKDVFNEAAAAYATAFEAYSVYRATSQNQADVSVAIGNLTVSVIALENALEKDMHVSSAEILRIQTEALRIRKVLGANETAIDILTELEIAAAVAEAVPAAQPYSALAAIVIAATQQALADESAASGQPIDLSAIQPVSSIQ